MPKWLEVIGVIALPLAYGLAVSGFFDWLHRRRAARCHGVLAPRAGAGGVTDTGPPRRPVPPPGPASDKGGAK